MLRPSPTITDVGYTKIRQLTIETMDKEGWKKKLLFEAWVDIDDSTVSVLNENANRHGEFLYTYVDWTKEPTPRAFYVGKGNRDRVRSIDRNVHHERITEKFGMIRHVMLASVNENDIFNEEIKLVCQHGTYRWGSEDRWGANLTTGGDGARGSKRPEATKEAARRAVMQLTLSNELVKIWNSAKEAIDATGAGVTRCCQGHLTSSKGFRWRYVEPERAVMRSVKTCERMKKSAKKRGVVQLAADGTALASFSCVAAAAIATGVGHANISRVCYRDNGTAGGFRWRFEDRIDLPFGSLATTSSSRRKRVMQLTLAGELVATFASVSEATQTTGIWHVSAACRGDRPNAGGYTWMYQDQI